MNSPSSQACLLRRIGSIALRLVIVCTVIAALLYFALAMVLNMVLNGPSVTARNELALVLLANESTRDIPSRFLDQQTLDLICRASDTLPASVSDPALITVSVGTTAHENISLSRGTASVTLRPASHAFLPSGVGRYYCGLTTDGILVVSTDTGSDAASPCEAILIMTGQVNEGLYNLDSGHSTRTAIGQTADGTTILVTVNGSLYEGTGATMQELINIMIEYGAINACCLRSGNASEG